MLDVWKQKFQLPLSSRRTMQGASRSQVTVLVNVGSEPAGSAWWRETRRRWQSYFAVRSLLFCLQQFVIAVIRNLFDSCRICWILFWMFRWMISALSAGVFTFAAHREWFWMPCQSQ